MKNALRMLALTSVFALPSVWASTPGPNFQHTQTPYEGSFSDSSSVSGSFTDSISIPLVAGDGYWTITSENNSVSSISNFTVDLYSNGVLIPGTFTTTALGTGGHSSYFWTEDYPTLTAGVYTLDFNGTFGPHGGAYGGTFSITPAVPEPSTWAAMLIGGMLMASIVVRQRKIRG